MEEMKDIFNKLNPDNKAILNLVASGMVLAESQVQKNNEMKGENKEYER